MFRLRVERVRSTSRLSGALSPGQAGNYGSYDGEFLIVEDEELAGELSGYHNVGVVSSGPEGGVNGSETTFQCGVNGCSRKVESETDVCWQHEPEGE